MIELQSNHAGRRVLLNFVANGVVVFVFIKLRCRPGVSKSSNRTCVARVDRPHHRKRRSRTIWIADAHRGDGKRFVARADEKLTEFLELESAIRAAERAEDCGGREIKFDKLSRTA